MDWTSVITFIDPALLIVIVACWVVGYALKQIQRIPDSSIIFVVTAFAIVVVSLTQGWNVNSLLQGILCGAVAVYGNQIVKQVKKVGDNDVDSGTGTK